MSSRVALADVPVGKDLADAEASTIAKVGSLFGVLDLESRPRSVRGTTLAKVLHRKRPALVPLYDEQVRCVYQEGPNAPVPPVARRSWVDFMTLLATSMQADLRRDRGFWDEVRGRRPAGGPPVSALRALDIVAWQLGPRTAIESP